MAEAPVRHDYEGPTPDPSFLRALRYLDPDLGLAWEQTTEHYCLTRKTLRGRQVVLHVVNDDNTYRPLDMRTLVKLGEIDGWKSPRWESFLGRVDAQNAALIEKRQAEREDQLRYQTRDAIHTVRRLPEDKK